MLKNLEEGKVTEREPTPGAGAPTPMGPVLNISKNDQDDQSQDIVSPEDKSSSNS